MNLKTFLRHFQNVFRVDDVLITRKTFNGHTRVSEGKRSQKRNQKIFKTKNRKSYFFFWLSTFNCFWTLYEDINKWYQSWFQTWYLILTYWYTHIHHVSRYSLIKDGSLVPLVTKGLIFPLINSHIRSFSCALTSSTLLLSGLQQVRFPRCYKPPQFAAPCSTAVH